MVQVNNILGLADELLQLVLEHLVADPYKSLTVDKRAYLSQESFKAPPAPLPTQAEDVGNLRLACSRFDDIAARQQFRRVTTRFSCAGLERLEAIAERKYLARHVNKFSYMMPCFHIGDRQSISSLITMIQACPGEPQVNVEIFRRKLHDEHEILRTETDLRALEKAMAAFAHLQHIQILRVQDREDEKLLDFVRYHDNAARPLIELNWASACLHSTKTIGSALLASHSKCTRFSSPMMSPLTAFTFGRHPPSTFSMLAVRLTCLELHFDGDHDLDARMLALSGLFNHVFKAAVNMEAVHVGFPSHRPLSLPLETLFHNVQWRKLIAFGVQGWKLDSGEIIGLARRHKDRLKGLRLRDVLLKDGSTWKDTLGVLRSEMLRLEWVSLRRIGYARIFDEQRANPGIEVSDDAQGSSSESDYESDIESEGVSEDFSEAGPATSDYTSESDHGSDDEYGPAAHVLSFPSQLSATDRLGLMPWCTCGRRTRPERMEDLDDDDGSFIDNEKRKRWEKWVLGRCPEHDVEI